MRHRRFSDVVAVGSCVSLSTLCACHTGPTGASYYGDDRQVRDAVESYYSALSDRDWEAFQACFWPGATIVTIWQPPGASGREIYAATVPEFVARAPEGPGSRPIFEERPTSIQIRNEGDLGQAWARYSARFGDEQTIIHWTGIDAISLLRQGIEWRITSITFASDEAPKSGAE